MQPLVRHKAIRSPAFDQSELDEGKSYLPRVQVYEFTVSSGSGTSDFLYVPAGTWVEKAVVLISEALDAGTVDLGTDGTADALVANTELTETSAGSIATSTETTAPNGLYFTAEDMLRLTVGGAATEGVIVVMLVLWNFTEIASQGYHDEITIPES